MSDETILGKEEGVMETTEEAISHWSLDWLRTLIEKPSNEAS